MKLVQERYTLNYDPLEQQINFEGIFRPGGRNEVDLVVDYLIRVHDQIQGTLNLNFRRLRYMNATGMTALSRFVCYAREQSVLRIRIIGSGVLAWAECMLPNLCELWDQVEYIVHDRDFYRSQEIIENADFIPLLRNQTRILWPLEQDILVRHGLRSGMRVADICCGCGDVPLLISREMQPSFMLGVDHSGAAVEYARRLQRDFQIANAEFQRGDATALMLDDNSFDFVLCRLSLQIFSEPTAILAELIRIARPGGRIYVLCEDYDLIVGHPEDELIAHTYERAAVFGDAMGMDLRSGKKLYRMLTEARLEAIQTDHLMVDTSNSDRQAMAAVIESWRGFSVDTIGDRLALSENEKAALAAGYNAQLRSIRSPYGYSTWGLIACSGSKPHS
ncbi:MAG: methyltransferase domain-containing protein [Caldilineaceae bacterium]|nr:methyltransferase domain-containing protein [Caldilineaceae bacterium]